MPRRKPRNPLKRKEAQADFDNGPDTRINKRKKSSKSQDPKDEPEGGDTPKAFKRLLTWSKRMQEGRKEPDESSKEVRGRPEKRPEDVIKDLKIQPGERMSDFSRRVNEALPLVKTRKGSPSRADKKKMKKRAKAEADRKAAKGSDDEDEDEDEDDGRSKKKGKREVSPDPWGHLESSRPKFGDVVDRPPELNLPTKLLRNVPKSAGSMARRVILEDERTRVIESYRALMESKKISGE